jgi:hypothetical protein
MGCLIAYNLDDLHYYYNTDIVALLPTSAWHFRSWCWLNWSTMNCPKDGHSTRPQYAGSAYRARGRRPRCVPQSRPLGEDLHQVVTRFVHGFHRMHNVPDRGYARNPSTWA